MKQSLLFVSHIDAQTQQHRILAHCIYTQIFQETCELRRTLLIFIDTQCEMLNVLDIVWILKLRDLKVSQSCSWRWKSAWVFCFVIGVTNL